MTAQSESEQGTADLLELPIQTLDDPRLRQATGAEIEAGGGDWLDTKDGYVHSASRHARAKITEFKIDPATGIVYTRAEMV